MTLTEMRRRLKEAAEAHAAEICGIGEHVFRNPELGYKEYKTSAFVREQFDKLGMEYEYPLAITGVRATGRGRFSEAKVCIMGEMDAIKCPSHPFADGNGTVHACGHNAQIAAMLGAAMLLRDSGVMDELDGDVTFFAVPAEEFIDLDYRKELKAEGKIYAFGGKQQLIAEGAFDDIDMAMMIHAKPDAEDIKVYTEGHNLGFVAEKITFFGKAAHGSAPYDGTNALNAAALAILGIHSNRETFCDEERIRIHPIISKGGDVVNSVPDEVCIDTYVRGATREAIEKGCAALGRSVSGAAQIIGAMVETEHFAGYLPLLENNTLSEVFARSATYVLGDGSVVVGEEITGSTDAGDLSHLMPVIQPSIGGFRGGLHSREFAVAYGEVYTKAALCLALTVCELLCDGAALAKKIRSEFTPKLTKQEYIEYLRGK